MVSDERLRLWQQLDEDLKEFVDPAFGQHFLAEPRLIYEAIEPAAVAGDRLERAARHGAYIWLQEGSVADGERLSLSVLESVLPHLAGLWIRSTAAVDGIDVLAGGTQLVELHVEDVRGDASLDLSGLPRLRRVSGSGRALAKLGLLSSGCTAMSVSEPFPRSRVVIDAPVESLVLVNLGAWVQEPILRVPAALRELTIKHAKKFSLSALAECTELRSLDVWRCGDLTGLSALGGLSNLEKLTVEGSSTSADWAELLLAKAHQVTFSPADGLSADLRERMVRRGWTVPGLLDDVPHAFDAVRGEWDDDVDAYVICIDVAEFLELSRERGDRSLRTGEDIEAEISSLVHALPSDVDGKRVQFDSESDYVFAYIRFISDGVAVERILREWVGLTVDDPAFG